MHGFSEGDEKAQDWKAGDHHEGHSKRQSNRFDMSLLRGLKPRLSRKGGWLEDWLSGWKPPPRFHSTCQINAMIWYECIAYRLDSETQSPTTDGADVGDEIDQIWASLRRCRGSFFRWKAGRRKLP